MSATVGFKTYNIGIYQKVLITSINEDGHGVKLHTKNININCFFLFKTYNLKKYSMLY